MAQGRPAGTAVADELESGSTTLTREEARRHEHWRSEAVACEARVTRARPDWYGLHNGIGWCHLKLGRKAEARAAFQRALTLRPGYEDAVEGLRLASG